MDLAFLPGVLIFGVAVTGAAGGAALMLSAANMVQRLVGLAIAGVGAALTLASLGRAALEPLVLLLLVALAAQLMLGAALAVRAAELYGGVEMDALTGEDESDEERAE